MKIRKGQIIKCAVTGYEDQSWLVIKTTTKWIKIKPLHNDGKARRVDIGYAVFNIDTGSWKLGGTCNG